MEKLLYLISQTSVSPYKREPHINARIFLISKITVFMYLNAFAPPHHHPLHHHHHPRVSDKLQQYLQLLNIFTFKGLLWRPFGMPLNHQPSDLGRLDLARKASVSCVDALPADAQSSSMRPVVHPSQTGRFLPSWRAHVLHPPLACCGRSRLPRYQ